MYKLTNSIPSTNVKIIELFNKIDNGTLNMSPDFQRKLVWKKQHKFNFIETILKNFPFPEVYIASTEIDISNITSSEVVVDGQQRLSTIIDYIKGNGDFLHQKFIESFEGLDQQSKKDFLNYLISVRDLKDMDISLVKEVFIRINNTEYSLNTVEKTNAQYGDSEFVIFCKQLIDRDFLPSSDSTDVVIPEVVKNEINGFFEYNNIFTDNDTKRMVNLQFIMTLISTVIEGSYFNRNVKVSFYMERFNSSFDTKETIQSSFLSVIQAINKIGLSKNSYWFNKSNIFSLVSEFSKVSLESIDYLMLNNKLLEIETDNKRYIAEIEVETIPSGHIKYFVVAKEAVNERKSRAYRGSLIKGLISECQLTKI